MSGRQARKLMKQRDRDFEEENGKDSEEEEAEAQIAKVLNPFDLLTQDNDGDDGSEEEEQVPSDPKQTETANPTAGRRKRKKKSKKKKQNQHEEDEDDIDKVIQEVEHKFGKIPVEQTLKTATITQQPEQPISKLFAINAKRLDWEQEMIKNFGSGAVNAAGIDSKGKCRTGLKKRVLVSPKNTWPRVPPQGITMSQIEPNCFVLQHSPAYQEFEFMFYQCIETHNPDTLYEILRECPYHINALLQLSETFKQNGDVSMATDFVERALYSFECSFHPHFNLSLSTCRLDYNVVECRPVYVCVFRHIQYLSRKGCWKTAFEFSKLLFSLDPGNDPLAAVLLIDFYAVKSESYQWYIDYWEEFKDSKGLQHLPNAVYSAALCRYELESKKGKKANFTQANEMLGDAILRFPTVVHKCLSKMGLVDSIISNDPFFMEPNFENDAMSRDTILLLVDMYIESSFSNWKVPELLAWLKTVILL